MKIDLGPDASDRAPALACKAVIDGFLKGGGIYLFTLLLGLVVHGPKAVHWNWLFFSAMIGGATIGRSLKMLYQHFTSTHHTS